MKNIFNEKLSNGGEASPRNFYKKIKAAHISGPTD